MTLFPRAVTSPELAMLRSENQYSRLYMTVHVPTVVYSARLAAVPSSTDGVLSITYNSGSGTYTNILNDMTMYVGTSAGAYDLGMVRIRDITGIGATSGTFNIDEQSAVNWQSNCYLTVVDEFTIWRRNIRLQGTTPYIDELAYTDQNSKCDSVPCFGPHRVLWYTGSNIVTHWDASDSWTINNTITGYSWAAPGSVSITGGTTSTPTITYSAIGTYRVACTISNSDGKSFTGYRYVFVVAPGQNATTAFTLNSMEGSYSGGGWKAEVTLYDEASLSLIRDRALCIIHTVDYYGDTKSSLGFASDAENILMVGWINQEDIVQPIAGMSGSVTFAIETINYWLDQITAFPVGIKDRTGTPTKWTRWLGLTPKDIVWHQLHWRATATRCTDVFPLNIQWRASRIEAPGGQTLWEQLKMMEWQYVRATPCADRLNRLHNQIDIQMLLTADRANVPTIRSITTSDWGGGSISFERVVSPKVGLVDYSGVAWDGTTVTPIASLAPGKVFANFGKAEVVDRLVLYDQATTNTSCGLWFGWKTNQFPKIPMKLIQNERFIDIAPYMYVSLSIAAADNPRGVGYTGLAIPRQAKITHDMDTMTLQMEVELEAQTTASLSVTHVIPDIVVPNVQPPPVVVVPPVVPPSPSTTLVGMVGFVITTGLGTSLHLVYAGDFSYTGQPTWTLLALPSDFLAQVAAADLFDNVTCIQTNGGRLMLIGTKTAGAQESIWECTNWTSIKSNPTPPAPSWTKILSYNITTIGGSTITPVSTLSAGNCAMDAAGNVYFTCKLGGIFSIGKIDSGGGVTSFQPASLNNNLGISNGIYNDISLVGGTSHARQFTGSDFFSFTGSVFGSSEGGSPYRNDIGSVALVPYFHFVSPGTTNMMAIKSAGGDALLFHPTGGSQIIMAGTPRASIVTASVKGSTSLWKSSDGATFSAIATWVYGLACPIKADGDTGFVWAAYEAISSGSVPVRLIDQAGTVVNDLTGNWWTIFNGATTSRILGFRAWYSS